MKKIRKDCFFLLLLILSSSITWITNSRADNPVNTTIHINITGIGNSNDVTRDLFGLGIFIDNTGGISENVTLSAHLINSSIGISYEIVSVVNFTIPDDTLYTDYIFTSDINLSVASMIELPTHQYTLEVKLFYDNDTLIISDTNKILNIYREPTTPSVNVTLTPINYDFVNVTMEFNEGITYIPHPDYYEIYYCLIQIDYSYNSDFSSYWNSTLEVIECEIDLRSFQYDLYLPEYGPAFTKEIFIRARLMDYSLTWGEYSETRSIILTNTGGSYPIGAYFQSKQEIDVSWLCDSSSCFKTGTLRFNYALTVIDQTEDSFTLMLSQSGMDSGNVNLTYEESHYQLNFGENITLPGEADGSSLECWFYGKKTYEYCSDPYYPYCYETSYATKELLWNQTYTITRKAGPSIEEMKFNEENQLVIELSTHPFYFAREYPYFVLYLENEITKEIIRQIYPVQPQYDNEFIINVPLENGYYNLKASMIDNNGIETAWGEPEKFFYPTYIGSGIVLILFTVVIVVVVIIVKKKHK